MRPVLERPTLVDEGVLFMVSTLDYTTHQCLISVDTLHWLSRDRSAPFGPVEIFEAYEAKILGVARRLIAARVKSDPLRLDCNSFT